MVTLVGFHAGISNISVEKKRVPVSPLWFGRFVPEGYQNHGHFEGNTYETAEITPNYAQSREEYIFSH